jgi:hypothetical protein
VPDGWPDTALEGQASSMGPAILELIDSERRWVHRRVERIELLNATQATRSVATDLTVPPALADALRLRANGGEPDIAPPVGRFVLPLGILPKEPLEDFSITPVEVHRLTADQSNPLIVAALTPYARRCGAPPTEVLKLARRIVRSEAPVPQALAELEALLEEATDGDVAARDRLRSLARSLNESYVLLAATKAEPGMPMRIAYTHRKVVGTTTGDVCDPPLVLELPLPHASGGGSAYRVEVVAPDGLEVETASIVALEGTARRPVESFNTQPGAGAFVQLRAPEPAQRPERAGLQVTFGWPSGGIHHVATIAGSASTLALLTATLVSYALNEKMKGSSAGTLLAAPALVTSLALGFATTRVTSKAVNRLRFAALWVALLGVAGALTVSLLAENASRLKELHGILIGCTALSLLVTAGFPGRAVLRQRAFVPLDEAP